MPYTGLELKIDLPQFKKTKKKKHDRDGTQGIVHARKALYYSATLPRPFILFLREGLAMVA